MGPRIAGPVRKVLHRRLQGGLVPRLPRFRSALLDSPAIGRKPKGHRAGQFGDRRFGSLGVEAEAPDHQRDPRRAGLQFRVEQHGPGVDLERPRAVGADARQRAGARRLDEARVGRSVEPDGERPLDVDDARVRRAAAAGAGDFHAACRLHLTGGGDRRRRGLMGACDPTSGAGGADGVARLRFSPPRTARRRAASRAAPA